jgi:hypothetical protein
MAFITGQVVRDKNFWNRKNELENIWDAIQNNEHCLLVAPRRVGKTSIMYKIKDNAKKDYIVLYIDSEEDDFEYEFWNRVFKTLQNEEFTGKLKTNASKFIEQIKKINIKKITLNGVEFEDKKTTNYKEAFEELMSNIPQDLNIVIMIDEFAQTIENIIKYDSEKNALSLLKSTRALRQSSKLNNITFIYAGSIGLESVVAKLDGMKHINDLKNINIDPLDKEDAKEFVQYLLENNNLKLESEQINYMLEEIQWLIPFYIQLILDEVNKLNKKTKNISNTTIDDAINNAIAHRNYFDNWRSKIKEAFDNKSYLFSKELLNIISQNNIITKNEIENLANKYELSDDEKRETTQSLVYDGYINNNSNITVYRFNSPILKLWWYKNVAN